MQKNQTLIFAVTALTLSIALACAGANDSAGLPLEDNAVEGDNAVESYENEFTAEEDGEPENEDTETKAFCGIRPDHTSTIELHSGALGEYGNWDECMTYCPAGWYAYAMELVSEPPQGGGDHDDTALNGVHIRCNSKSDFAKSTWITGGAGGWGEFGSIAAVQPDVKTNPMVGARILFEAHQVGEFDDTTANAIKFKSLTGTVSVPEAKTSWGDWYPYQICPNGTAVCGIRNKVEAPNGGDDTSLNDVQFACCTF